MTQNIRSKKFLMIVSIFFCIVLVFPLAQVANVEGQESKNSFENSAVNGLGGVVSTPLLDNVPPQNLTIEEVARLMCMPGFFTPEQITFPDKLDRNYNYDYDDSGYKMENSGGLRGSNPQTIKVLLLVDEEAENIFYDMWWNCYDPYNSLFWTYTPDLSWCYYWADNIIAGGSTYLAGSYGIEFRAGMYDTYGSPNNMNYHQLVAKLSTDYANPASYGCDVVVLLSGQNGYNNNGNRIQGCTNQIGGKYSVLNINYDYGQGSGWHSIPLDNLFQHETSHYFSCFDHQGDPNKRCIMTDLYISSYRGYCTQCDSQLVTNRFRFEMLAGYATSVTLVFESGGGADVFNEGGILGAKNDGNYTYLYSGSAGNKAVLNVQMSKPSSSAAISGRIYLFGYTGSSQGNHLMIYVTYDGVTWHPTPIKNTNFYSPNKSVDIDCGYISNFKGLSIVVINDLGYAGTVYIDSIHVHS